MPIDTDAREITAEMRRQPDRLEARVLPPLEPASGARLPLEDWYRRRVEWLERSNENEGRAAALAAVYLVPREVIRGLREQFAPAPWRRRDQRRS